MRKIVCLAAVVALPLLAGSVPAQARDYPWCAVYGQIGSDVRNCGFDTIAQCRATVSGIGGYCEPNRFYAAPSRRPHRRH